MNTPLGDLLSVDAVLNRYGLRDRRAARRLMDAAGAFKVGANLYVRAADLAAHEAALITARQTRGNADHPNTQPQAKRPRRTTRKVRQPLPPDWWRDPAGDQAEGSLAPQNPRR